MTIQVWLQKRWMNCQWLAVICLALPPFAHAQSPRREDCRAADLLPKTVVACAEVPNLGDALHTIMNHPLRAKLEAMPAYTQFMQSGPPKQLQVGINAFEASMEMPWQKALATLSAGGVTVALDAADGGVALLFRSSDEAAMERFCGFVLAARMLQGGATKRGDYRGFQADSLNENLKMVRMHDWLLLTNKSELGKSIIDQYVDRGNPSLAENEKYAAAIKQSVSGEKQPFASAYVDVEELRSSGIAKNLTKERVDNFGVELLAGGILANLRHTDYATAALDLNQKGISLRVSTPHQRQWESPREYFFGSPELAVAPSMLNVQDRLFAISAYRDISQMWLRCGDLLSDKANDQLAAADTQLTTFFAGRDFGEDILGALESDVQIVGKVPAVTDQLPQPSIKLPAFAIEFRMKNPAETQPELRRVFQAFVGFLTITGAMNGQPQLDLGMEKVGDAQLVTATFVPKREQRESREAPIQFNFSPTLGFSGERVVLASSTLLARELLGVDRKEIAGQAETASQNENDSQSQATATASNTIATLDASALQRILYMNKSQLVANSMLEKGHSREAAESEVGLLLDVVGFIRQARLRLDISESLLTFAAQIDVSLP